MIMMSRSVAYSLIVVLFCSWPSKTNNSISKVSIVFLFSFVLYLAVLVGVKQIVGKVYLKNAPSHRVKVLNSIIHHPYIYKIMKFELVSKRL